VIFNGWTKGVVVVVGAKVVVVVVVVVEVVVVVVVVVVVGFMVFSKSILTILFEVSKLNNCNVFENSKTSVLNSVPTTGKE